MDTPCYRSPLTSSSLQTRIQQRNNESGGRHASHQTQMQELSWPGHRKMPDACVEPACCHVRPDPRLPEHEGPARPSPMSGPETVGTSAGRWAGDGRAIETETETETTLMLATPTPPSSTTRTFWRPRVPKHSRPRCLECRGRPRSPA